jgi:hypothetical protein
MQEAVQVACALKRRWAPHGKVPGLRALPDLSLSHADEILSVVRAVQEAQFLCYLEEASAPLQDEEPPLVKARRLINALRVPLEYLEKTLPTIAQAQVKKFKGLPEQKQEDNASLSLLLRLYIEVASSAQQQLSTLGESFDLAQIGEAKQQLLALQRLAEDGPPQPPKQARGLYYQMLALLIEKVGEVRAAAGYLYRGQKAVLKEFTSAYERNRRRKSKQAKKTQR